MSVKNFYIFIIASIATLNLTIANAQHYIGFTGGYSIGTFTNFTKKQEYDANYHLKNGATISSFYETKIDSICSLKIELQYKWQNVDMEINNNVGHASFYKKIDYSLHLLNLNLICSFRLVEKKSFKLRFLLGTTFSYNLNTHAKGNGWEYYSQTQIDTNGNLVQILTTREWKKNERNSKDLSVFNVGLDCGLDFIFPINDKMDFLIQNRYNILLINIAKQKNLRYTSLFSGYLNIGFRYNFRK
jgi:hypothetical protein